LGGYLRAAADQRQLQNVTASLGPHAGLRGRHAAVTAGYHLSKRRWNIVTLDGSVPDDEVLELIGHAYDLVVAHLTKAQQSKLIT
jgi:predicted DNA-binding protein (MmcQ/YjbR family)